MPARAQHALTEVVIARASHMAILVAATGKAAMFLTCQHVEQLALVWPACLAIHRNSVRITLSSGGGPQRLIHLGDQLRRRSWRPSSAA
eukprot:scaffold154562_cov24-Tisochrysis_lutea.AAC.3